jgi:hypothetical protein
MTDQHSLTPPPDKHKQWEDDILCERENVDVTLDCAWRDGFRAGADQELEACIEWLIKNQNPRWAGALQKARHPKPLSLKAQALEALETEDDSMLLRSLERSERFELIRRALEQLDD